MFFYAAPYAFLILSIFLIFYLDEESDIYWKKIVFFAGVIPAIFIAIFRGDVGTDTGNYFQMAFNLLEDGGASNDNFDIEVGFFWLLKCLSFLFEEPRFIVNFVGFLIAWYSCYLFSKNIESMAVFALLLFPVFFFDMTMNGLRYGLAFLLAKHASDEINSGKKVSPLVLICLSVGFQLSGLLVFVLLQTKRLRVVNLLFFIPILIFLFFIFEDRLLYKYSSYVVLDSPDGLSGLVPLLVFFACYLVFIVIDKEESKNLYFLLVLQICSFFLARISYAGLRFQLLILFVLFCYISMVKFKFWKNRNLAIILFLLVGLIGFVGKLRNFNDGIGMSPTPFLPYHFFWEMM